MRHILATIVFMLLATAGFAQTASQGTVSGKSPYAGLERREIKALSPEQLSDLRAGRGMSLALAAELNGYPGPKHVLEFTEPLALTPDQHARTTSLFAEMERNATALGARLIEAEQRLDTLFTSGRATTDGVRAATADIASLQGQLRALHLSYHLDMKAMLTPQQIAQYNALRGYHAAARH